MLTELIQEAKAKRWAQLVSQRADELCEARKYEDDLFVQLLTGKIFEDAVEQVALEIRSGLYDEMLMPKECNL